MITSIRNAALTIAAASMVASPVAANVGDSMDRFMDDMGAAANVTGPSAFEGQSAGYYSLGNVWTRFPQKTTNIANLQLPRARAGCGGIDIFAGSFSFINASEMVALLKAVANNAVGFAFSLAIDAVCPECNKIMQEFSQKAQLMNNLSINSCEMAQGLVGGVWPKGDLADKAICEAIGNSEGIFTDYAAAKHGCGTRGQRASTNEGAGAEYADVNPGVPRNYTWHVLKQSAFFNPGGTFDRDLAEYAMTLIGSMVEAIRSDTAIGDEEKELLQVASVPLYKILTVQAAYGRGMATDDRDTLAEIASIDLLYAILERITAEAGRSMASFIAADEVKLEIWRAQVAEVRSSLAQRQATGQARVSAIMQIIEKTAMIENMLAASMSPSMAAALDWSRGMQSRSIVP